MALDKQEEAEISIPHEMADESGDWEVLVAGNLVSARSKRRVPG